MPPQADDPVTAISLRPAALPASTTPGLPHAEGRPRSATKHERARRPEAE